MVEEICKAQAKDIFSERITMGLETGEISKSKLAMMIKEKFDKVLVSTFFKKVASGGGDSDHTDHHKEHILEYLGYMMICFILIFYLSIGSYMELKMFKWGHETGVIILGGITISIIITLIENEKINFLVWNNALFFDLLLPLIIFTTGYNIRRRKFFSNIVNISKFGLMGTILTFIFLTCLTWGLFHTVKLQKCMYKDGIC